MYSRPIHQVINEDLMVEKTQGDVKLPEYAEPGSVGMDLFAPCDVTLEPGKRVLVNMQIKCKFPSGVWGKMEAKSGLGSKKGIDVMAGVIDNSYRGIIHALMINHGEETHIVKKGEKLVQMIIMPCLFAEVKEGKVDADTQRGENGFGSTGK